MKNEQKAVEFETAYKRPSLLGAIAKKYIEWLVRLSGKGLVIHITELVIGVFVVVFSVSQNFAIFLFLSLLGYVGKPILAILAIFLLFRWRMVRSFFRRKKREFSGNQHTMNGVPKDELLHLLFDTGGFRLEDAHKRLGMSRKNFDPLARTLERFGVLVRGEKNARVLSPRFSRHQIRRMIEKGSRHGDIRYIDKNDGLSPQGLAHDVENMVEENEGTLNPLPCQNSSSTESPHSPTPFTIRRIA